MSAYQDLVSERNSLKRKVADLQQRVNKLEGSTPLILARRLSRFEKPAMALLEVAFRANRLRRRIVYRNNGPRLSDMRLWEMEFPTAAIDKARRTVIVISQVASRTGAPILAWNIARELAKTYNVVTVLMEGGPLQSVFADAGTVVGPVGPLYRNVTHAAKVAWNVVQAYDPVFVIANTAESRYLAVPFAREGIPVITLIHEFAADVFPKDALQTTFDWAAEVVFPAAVVRDSYKPGYSSILFKRERILPQGQSEVPVTAAEATQLKQPSDEPDLADILRPQGQKDALLVVGMGSADFRKGADIFIATATIVKRLAPNGGVRFAWIGSAHDPLFHTYMVEQLYRSGVDDILELIPTLPQIEAVYDAADLLFVSSRLDPLPNVAIDMALKAKPVLCFANATGFAGVLQADPVTAPLVVPYLDAAKAAEVILQLAGDRAMVSRMGEALKATAAGWFDMPRYVAELARLGEAASADRKPREARREVLLRPGSFDLALYTGKVAKSRAALEGAVDHYLNYAGQIALLRRALAGFHPGIYAHLVPEVTRSGWTDPLVHYIEAGKPDGPWVHPVIDLSAAKARTPMGTIALHGHFHYTDNIAEFMAALAVNAGQYDLFLTTSSEEKAAILRQATSGYRQKVEIEVVSNKGRDIGPFLHVLRKDIIGKYEIVGHLHGKRSTHVHSVGPKAGDLWRNFLWQHLLGPKVAAADIIVSQLLADPKLGVVFPEDPNIIGWDFNRDFAEELAKRMHLGDPLPEYIDFPAGTMFWARSAAMEPFLGLDLTWEDYPPEPLPVDGSFLHAMERLIPFVAKEAGYEFATSHLPGVGRMH